MPNLPHVSIFFVILSLSVCFTGTISAQEKMQTDNDVGKLLIAPNAEPSMLTVSADLLSLLPLSESNSESTKKELKRLLSKKNELNSAEQYILLLIKANVARIDKNEDIAIELLNEAIMLEGGVNKNQLNSPVFAKAYKILAVMYENKNDYEQAYKIRKKYIKKYFSHLKQEKNMRVKRLNQKYQVEKKHEENELLEQNSKLKQFALLKAESEINELYRNIVLIILTGVVFLFLLFRQLQVRRKLKRRGTRDKLTQLVNRREFFTSGSSAVLYAREEKQKLCVVIIDIDNVKYINDVYGRDIADNVIKCVANFASETMRSRDILARFGGEEFSAILPDATVEEARAMAERIREKIQNKSANNLESKVNVTVSIGIASIDDIDGDFDSLIGAAGIALHHAQMNGYNQVCNYPVNAKNH